MKNVIFAILVVMLSACAAEPAVPEPIAEPEVIPEPEAEPVVEPVIACGDGACDASEALPEWTMVWPEELEVESRAYDLMADTCEGSRCLKGTDIGSSCFGNTFCGRGCAGECIIIAEKKASYCSEDC